MKQYNLKPQEDNNLCVCSCFQAVFNNYGISLSQRQIAFKLTPAEKGFLIHDDRVKQFLSSQGFSYEFYRYNETPFNEPDFLLEDNKEKKHIIIGVNSHSYLLVYFKDPVIHILDPEDACVKQDNLSGLLRKMHEKDSGGFGLISKL